MEQYKDRTRKKAFIGAIIGAAGSIAGGIIGARKRKKAAKREAERKAAIERNEKIMESTNSLNESLQGQDELQENFLNQYMKYGGSVKSSKYKSRDAKAFGGIGELIGGLMGGASSVVGAATGSPKVEQAGKQISNYVQGTIANRNAKRIEEQKEDIAAEPAPVVSSPTVVKPVQRYGGRSMPTNKTYKVRPKR